VEGPPSVDDYVVLRERSGLSPKTTAQAVGAVAASWAWCHVVAPGGETVGMGRVIGDGAWYFHVADMAVLPDHQRRGIGDAVLAHLLARIDEAAEPDPFISLLADPPGRRLYERHGFVETAPHNLGMWRPPRSR
jgi:ribosomal protein S18 acetylase RimI-like enzyme